MKNLYLTLIFFIALTSYSQTEKKNMLAANGAWGSSQLFTFQNALNGASSLEAKNYYALGIDYSHLLTKHWEICTGIMYGRNTITEHVMGIPPSMPAHDNHYILKLISIPALMKYHFWNYFFVNGGLYINADLSTIENRENQSGLGFGAGIGAEYTFSCGLVILLNPYFQWNGIVPSQGREHYQLENEGIKMGIGYRF